jgi:hypothetical protein
MEAVIALPAQQAQSSEDDERKVQMPDAAAVADERSIMGDIGIGTAAALLPPSSLPLEDPLLTAQQATEHKGEAMLISSDERLPAWRPLRSGIKISSFFSLGPLSKGGASDAASAAPASFTKSNAPLLQRKAVPIHPDVRKLVDGMCGVMERFARYDYEPWELQHAKCKVAAMRKEVEYQARLDAAPKRDRPDRRPAAAVASRRLMQQAREEEEVSGATGATFAALHWLSCTDSLPCV